MRNARYILIAISISLVLFTSLSVILLQSSATTSTPFPPYAKAGAYAFYSGNGGFIPFLSGVSGNVSYFVSNVYSNNNSMRVVVNENISLGTELTVNTTMISQNVTDSIFAPITFLAVSPTNLTSREIVFQNTDCAFVKNAMYTISGVGTFNATEFQGSVNGTTEAFWFDRNSGLVIEMDEAGSYFQLVNSNIAVPVQSQSTLAAEIPFILVFVVGWAGAGVLFYMVRRHYIKKSERESKTTVVEGKHSRRQSAR